MMLHDAIQIHQLAVDIVKYLDGRGHVPKEIQRGTAAEDLDIAFVLRKKWEKLIGKASFAADPGNDCLCH